MLIYHSYMDTDIDKWDVLSFEKPEKDDEWWWNYDALEIDSLYHFLDWFGNLSKFENIEEFLPELIERLKMTTAR